MEATKELIDAIQQAVKVEKVEVDGQTYLSRNVYMPVREPDFPTIQIHSLTGMIAYLESDLDGDVSESALHVVSPTEVRLVGAATGRHLQRNFRAQSVAVDMLAKSEYALGNFYTGDRFQIFLQTHFVRTEPLKELLKMVGLARNEQITQEADDGVTQNITVRAGVVLNESARLPNPVTLTGYRTFREVNQPEQEFILRARRSDKGIEYALFEGDGHSWKLQAIENIRAWLESEITDIPIIA